MTKKRKAQKKILCRICGELIQQGKYKTHRIEKHGASNKIKQKSKPIKKKKHLQSTLKKIEEATNKKPFQGGAPGLGKKS
ncbi:MAG: hypothetical protein K1563_16050 [Candidatus Thiodiazotropha sp. (ex. Lucinisca nassula)]|nr:hypothetical protein [Candidatus Thiodiazotropha sp. (ex. Lucinisca nassula)]MBW9275194.1 hypothetical protein [Candidatus Thiodiazotropha sp. (ex. Lucinisca nassula)]